MLLVQAQTKVCQAGVYCTAERMCVRKVSSGRAAQGLVDRVWISDFKFKEKPLEVPAGNGMLRLHI